MDKDKQIQTADITKILLDKKKQSSSPQISIQKDLNKENIVKEKIEEKTAEYDLTENLLKKGKKVTTIDIRIKKVGQLFNSFDPSPFMEKDLDDDATEYILGAVRESPINEKMRILIHLPKIKKNRTPEMDIRQAIHNFFEYKKVIAQRNRKQKFKELRRSFLIGICFLAFCLILVNLISMISNNFIITFIAEVFTIIGWVAMWPIGNILYDWFPLLQEINICRKLSEMEIDFIYE